MEEQRELCRDRLIVSAVAHYKPFHGHDQAVPAEWFDQAARLLVLGIVRGQTASNTNRREARRVAVQNETKSQDLLSPLEFWQRWSEIATRMWINTIQSNQSRGTEPSDFYSSWARST